MTRRRFSGAAGLGLAAGLMISGWIGHSTPVAAQQATSPPSTGFRAELLADLARLEQKLVGLAEAVSEEDMEWRPNDQVRRTSEVFMHIVVSNYRILAAVGATSTESTDELEEITGKQEIIGELQSSIEAFRRAVISTEDADLETSIEFFGREWSKRALFYLAATHMHEHLGQAVAYGRSCGIVPPWSQNLPEEEAE